MFSRIIDAVREDRDSRETRAEIGLQIWKAKLWAMYHVDVQRVVPKSYPSEGQPRSTSDEFPSRVVFGNFR